MLDKDTIDLIHVCKANGYTLNQIVEETGVPRTTVHRVLNQPQRADPEGIDLLRARIEELEKFKELCLSKFPELRPKKASKVPKVGTIAWMQWAKTVTPEEAAEERRHQEEQAQYN